jgi:hypothetical protein
VTTFENVKQMYTVKVGAGLETRERVVSVPVTRMVRVSLDDKEVTVYDAGGKKIDPAKLPKLRGATPALLSADGKEVDPFYLRVAREGTLVIVAPQLASVRTPPGKAAPPRTPQ